MKYILIIGIILSAAFLPLMPVSASQMIPDRPGRTESSAVVPFRALQIESGFEREYKETPFSKYWGYVYHTTMLRYGLSENFELRMAIDYLGWKVDYVDPLTDPPEKRGFSPLYAGFKFRVMEGGGLAPEIALLGAMNLPFVADEEYETSYIAPEMKLAFTHYLSDFVTIGYNLGAEWDGESGIPYYFYSLGFGFGITNYLGIFVETYGLMPEEGREKHLFHGGLTFPVLPNLHLDASAGFGYTECSIDNFFGFGATLRIPE